MKINHFSQQGKRSNNEDSLGMSAGLLTVCDGMGGHNYGERASAFVKEAMLKAFAEPQPIGKMEIQQQLNKVQMDINQLLEKEPELEKMGTTFTGVFITPDVWYAAHIGDSRIYLFRPSEKKLWHTWDHSLVGELMRTKEITTEAGRFHPMSNRISKAIIAQKDGKSASASIVKVDELKKGDILMLCSDGVVEGWGDHELVKLFSDANLSFEQKCKKLKKQCSEKSKDNNTAIIAEVEENDAFSYGNNDELDWTTFDEVEADYQQYLKDNEETKEDSKAQKEPSASVDSKKPVQAIKESPAVESPSPIEATPHPNRPYRPNLQFPQKSKKLLWGGIAGVVLVAVVVLALIFIPKGKRTEEPANNTEMIEQHPAKTEAEKKMQGEEAAAFNAIKTIEDCDNYLKTYRSIATPERIRSVENKKAAMMEKAKEEAEKLATEKEEPSSNEETTQSNKEEVKPVETNNN